MYDDAADREVRAARPGTQPMEGGVVSGGAKPEGSHGVGVAIGPFQQGA
jgi:hypothetical protein